MKVALINPKGTIFSRNKRLAAFLERSVTMGSFRHFWSAPCLGLLVVAAYCPDEWQLCYIDENQRPVDFGVRYDLVLISAMTVQAKRAYEIADAFRRTGTPVVMGGIHATVMPEEALAHVDAVLAGEGEVLFPQLIEDLVHGRLRRLYREETPGGFDLAQCRTPRYDLLEGYDYPVVNLYTTRGCPRKCTFCCASNVYGMQYRRKSNAQILREMAWIDQLYPDRLLLFADDNAFVLRRPSKELLQSMIPMRLRWIAQTDISIARDAELLSLMAAAGCQWIVIGFESVSEQSLRTIETGAFKQSNLARYRESIEIIRSYGIGIYGTFIVGLDADSDSVFDDTARFILDNRLYGANITVPTPLPGTQLRERLLAEGRVLERGWEDYTLWDVVVTPATMTPKRLEDGLYTVYQSISAADNANLRLRRMLQETRARSRSEPGKRGHEQTVMQTHGPIDTPHKKTISDLTVGQGNRLTDKPAQSANAQPQEGAGPPARGNSDG